jgi:hypothetical protein
VARGNTRFRFRISPRIVPGQPFDVRTNPLYRVAQTDREHRLARVLQKIDNLLRRGLAEKLGVAYGGDITADDLAHEAAKVADSTGGTSGRS